MKKVDKMAADSNFCLSNDFLLLRLGFKIVYTIKPELGIVLLKTKHPR